MKSNLDEMQVGQGITEANSKGSNFERSEPVMGHEVVTEEGQEDRVE